jgi:heterodisulfide reductase subunit A-like polyferredoxin
MGAVLSVVGRFGRRQMVFKSECKNCNACTKSFCDYQVISPGSLLPVIAQNECSRCGECVSRCPRNAMDFTQPKGQAMKPGENPRQATPETIPVAETA